MFTSSTPASAGTASVATGSKPFAVTEQNFQETVLQSKEPVVVDFWAPWCGPCRQIAPVLDRLAGQFGGQVKVGKVNVDDEGVLANAFQIRGIPTLVVVRDGKVEGQIVGFPGAAPLTDLFDKLSRGEALR